MNAPDKTTLGAVVGAPGAQGGVTRAGGGAQPGAQASPPREAPRSPWALIDQLTERALAAETEAAIHFSMANDTFSILPYRSALVFRALSATTVHLVCASGLSTVERKSPYGSWVEDVIHHLLPRLADHSRFSIEDLPDEMRAAWREYWPERVVIRRVQSPGGPLHAVVVYLLEVEWPAVADSMLATLHRVHALCLDKLRLGRGRFRLFRRSADGRLPLSTKLGVLALVTSVAAMFIPIQQFVISPAEIISLESVAVTSPVEGIVGTLPVKPNQAVKAGDVLVRLDDTAIRNRLDAARQGLEVARAEYLTAAHRSFVSSERATEVAVLRRRINERLSEVRFLEEQLAMLEIRAARDGVAVYGQENDLIGKPVSPGQKLMELANPDRIGVRVWVPVADAINIETGAAMNVILYADPLNPRSATIERASYQASKSPDGVAAYEVRGTVAATDASRLGLRGNAKLDGEVVPLGYFLFRRPLIAVRQWLGV